MSMLIATILYCVGQMAWSSYTKQRSLRLCHSDRIALDWMVGGSMAVGCLYFFAIMLIAKAQLP